MHARDSTHTPLGAGAEFDVIRALLDEWGDLASDIGDDAAILVDDGGEQIVVSTDACVDGVHFQRTWITPRDVGVRAAAAALSDIAAMGARADAVLVSFIVPDAWTTDLPQVARGIGDVVRFADARIVGGNMSRGDQFSVTLTVIGRSATPIRRTGAQPGDAMLLTGTLGGPAAAVTAFRAGTAPDAWSLERFRAPSPRLAEGQWLATHGAHAMVDVSDGLLADAGHMARASGVDLVLDIELVPRGATLTVDQALRSGEEYELLVAFPASRVGVVADEFRRRFATTLTVVGEVAPTGAEGRVILRSAAGEKTVSRVEIPTGYDHFTA